MSSFGLIITTSTSDKECVGCVREGRRETDEMEGLTEDARGYVGGHVLEQDSLPLKPIPVGVLSTYSPVGTDSSDSVP